jgi:hypothetical protein
LIFFSSFDPPVAIIWSCRTKYFPRDLSFENHQFVSNINYLRQMFGMLLLVRIFFQLADSVSILTKKFWCMRLNWPCAIHLMTEQ